MSLTPAHDSDRSLVNNFVNLLSNFIKGKSTEASQITNAASQTIDDLSIYQELKSSYVSNKKIAHSYLRLNDLLLDREYCPPLTDETHRITAKTRQSNDNCHIEVEI